MKLVTLLERFYRTKTQEGNIEFRLDSDPSVFYRFMKPNMYVLFKDRAVKPIAVIYIGDNISSGQKSVIDVKVMERRDLKSHPLKSPLKYVLDFMKEKRMKIYVGSENYLTHIFAEAGISLEGFKTAAMKNK